jgi:hypothetical protein
VLGQDFPALARQRNITFWLTVAAKRFSKSRVVSNVQSSARVVNRYLEELNEDSSSINGCDMLLGIRGWLFFCSEQKYR